MDKEKLAQKISSLIQDPNFVLKLAETKSNEDAIKLFEDNDCELATDKVKLVRDTLNSLIKGDIKITEDDLENVSGGGKIDTTKVIAIALGATLVIGGTAWAVSAKPGSRAQAGHKGGGESVFWEYAGSALQALGPALKAGFAAGIKPTWWQNFKASMPWAGAWDKGVNAAVNHTAAGILADQ